MGKICGIGKSGMPSVIEFIQFSVPCRINIGGEGLKM